MDNRWRRRERIFGMVLLAVPLLLDVAIVLRQESLARGTAVSLIPLFLVSHFIPVVAVCVVVLLERRQRGATYRRRKQDEA